MRIIRSKDFLKSYKQKLDEASKIKALKYEYTTRYGTPKAGTSLRRHVLDKKAEELSSRRINPNTAPDGKQPIGAAGYRAGLSAAHMQGRIPYSGSRPTHTERRGVKKPRGAKFSDWVPSDIDKRNEEFELWVNSLVNEGYDLSEYTWDDVYEIYETYSNYLTVQAFLINEGYADSIQESDYMIENMDEGLIEEILLLRARTRWT